MLLVRLHIYIDLLKLKAYINYLRIVMLTSPGFFFLRKPISGEIILSLLTYQEIIKGCLDNDLFGNS